MDRFSDPVLGVSGTVPYGTDTCVVWHGDYSPAPESQPVVALGPSSSSSEKTAAGGKAASTAGKEDVCPDAVSPTKKGDKSSVQATYTSRVLALIFASEDSFRALQGAPREPLKMTCGNKYCVNLGHVRVD